MVDLPRPPFVERGHEESGLGEPDRVLRGLAPEVRPIASYLWSRADRSAPPAGGLQVPTVPSLDVLAAATAAVRDAIAEAGLRGLPAQEVRALHGRLDRAFVRLVAELHARIEAKSHKQLRDISHDLRSPLNSILFLVDALANEHSGQLNEVQRRQVGVLYTASLSLIEWLNDLIDASAIDDLGSIPVLDEPFSLEAVLDKIDRLLGPLAAHNGVELAFGLETLGQRRGDRRILSRVVMNLVSNAIEVTPRGGQVRVRARELRAGWLSVVVEDGGTAADPDRLRALLVDASRPAPLAGDRGQARGLGLSICARLIDAAGGRVEIEGGHGEPCRFLLEFPFARS